MRALLIRGLPDHIHARLKARARANRRSLAKEVLVLLEQALADAAGPPTLEQIDRVRVVGARPLGQDILDRGIDEGRA